MRGEQGKEDRFLRYWDLLPLEHRREAVRKAKHALLAIEDRRPSNLPYDRLDSQLGCRHDQ